MNDEIDKVKLTFFVKTGIVVLSLLLLIGLGVKYVPKAISISNSATSKKLPICSVETDEPKVALSFDAAWGDKDTQEILDILADNKVRATFFMTGGWIEKYPDKVNAIYEAGHDVANHSQNHKHMPNLNTEQMKEEIMKTHEKVKELLGVDMTLFRVPYGDYNNTVIDTANELNYHVIQWDVDSLDWKDYGVDSIIKKVLDYKDLGNGSIILLHNGAKYTKDALEGLIVGLQDKGFQLVPVSELIYEDDYYVDSNGRQCKK